MQLSIHRNVERINTLWKQLGYFSVSNYPERLGNAFRMLQEKKTSDEIFNRNFMSAEGWYSQLVFKANITTKLIGRGFDDFYRHPVVLYKGRLARCGLNGNITGCIEDIMREGSTTTVHTLPKISVSAIYCCFVSLGLTVTFNFNFQKELKNFWPQSDYIHISDNDGLGDSNQGLLLNSDLVLFLRENSLKNKVLTLEMRIDEASLKTSYLILEKLI